MKSSSKKILSLVLATALIIFLLFAFVEHEESAPSYPQMPLHVFEGSWWEMGKQYGENCTHIDEVYMFYLENWLNQNFSLARLKNDLVEYTKWTSRLEPKLIEFMKGIGEGSKKYLENVPYAEYFTPYEKIMLVNAGFETIWLPEWHESHRGACTGMACTKGATREGTVVGLNRDLPTHPFEYQVAYVLKPEKGGKIFGTVTEGQVASNFQVSDKPLFVGATKVLGDWNEERGIEECDYGVPSVIVMLYLSAFCSSAQEAVDTLCATKVTQGMNYIFADESDAVVVERTANHYACRAGSNVLVLTNHMQANYSYENHLRTDVSMSSYIYNEDPMIKKASEFSYYSAAYKLMENYGNITPATWINEISNMHYCYDKEGSLIHECNGKTPLEAGITIEYQGWNGDELVAATVASHCADLSTLDIYFVQGLPSEHEGIDKWQHANLNLI